MSVTKTIQIEGRHVQGVRGGSENVPDQIPP